MIETLTRLFGERGLAPHGYCLFWDPGLIWSHVVSDALIGLAYFSIPVVLAKLISKRRDIEFGWVVWLFAAFIMACGFTHFMSIFVFWVPAYGIQAVVKIITAAVSVATAVLLWPLLPKILAIPSPKQLQLANAQLLESISERDAALADLQREKAERERAEGMFRQAQKMEAIGQLTGGVAHDFNNLLTVVTGNLARALRIGSDDDKVRQSLNDAKEGAERAAKLTQQLLAFARRQPLQPTREDLSSIIDDIASLLSRSLDPHHQIDLDLASNLPPIMVDRSQTENAVLNLLINARDAMPDGGQVALKTFTDNDYVVLQVSDTGVGMDEATQSRAFEPFFTTKGLGHGSGLGLSQVFGFVKQSGGDVSIESAPASGTTVVLKFPKAKPND
jgi:signal transduction histidine kinase